MSKSSIGLETVDIALSLMEGLDCPRALTVAILLRYEEWDAIASLRCVPLHYDSADRMWSASVATGFLRKHQGLPTSFDLERKARDSFYASEHKCYVTNERLSPYLFGAHAPEDDRIFAFIGEVRHELLRMLGAYPPGNWEGKFGPGATMSDKSNRATVPDKLSSRPTFTPKAWPFLVPWTGTWWSRAYANLGSSPKSEKGNSFFTAPKDATAKRGCGKECSINVFYQLGLGSEMKQRIIAWGLNLFSAKYIHGMVTREASIKGHMCTIDLSSASDTVAYNLVKLLLPPAWFEVLDALRSAYTLVDGRWVKLEKFSSMGNGFTFELETAIFASIAKVACGDRAKPGSTLFVYGDDIIVPTDCAREVMSALSYFGFKLNEEKSFVSGPFRESCGSDFFDGDAVRPYHLKESPNEPQDYISICNGLRRVCSRLGDYGRDIDEYRFRRVRKAWLYALDQIPVQIRALRGPVDLGDAVIHDSENKWLVRWENSIRYVKAWVPAQFRMVRWEGFAYDVQFAAALYGVWRRHLNGQNPLRDEPKGLVPRDAVTGYSMKWVPFS